MNEPWFLRLRALLDERYAIVVAILLVFAIVGVGGVYATHSSPETETEERVVASWTENGAFDHGATVLNDTGPFTEGSEMTDRSVYFTDPMPELDGSFAYRYDAASGSVDTHTELELVIRSVDSEGEEVFWRVTDSLGETRTADLEPGESHEAEFIVDVNATNARIEAIESDLGASPGTTEVLVVARTTVEGQIAGESVEKAIEHDLQIEPSGSTYHVETPEPHEETHETVEQTTVPSDRSPIERAGFALLLVGSMLGFLTIVSAKRADLLVTDRDRRQIGHIRDRKELDDWITCGTLPRELHGGPQIETETLEGLVDVAIDCDRRVIEETTKGEYYVVDGDVVYVYRLPEEVCS